MNEMTWLDPSCRVALAALLHDLGKFAERARIDEAEQKDAQGIRRHDLNVQLVCPHYDGRPTHIHAAYTAIALDIIERHFPKLVGDDMTPFAPWKDKNADDSLINAAARHHRPETFLQWVIATADRVASGFERETFEQYNRDKTEVSQNHYTTRQWTLFEQIRLDRKDPNTEGLQYRYLLKPLTVDSLFPEQKAACQPKDNFAAQSEYLRLWQAFGEGLKQIPAAHRHNLALWLDHFDSLWQCFTHAIPSATAFNAKPDVSLYDHSKTVAALAVALWRYHAERGDSETALSAMRCYADWDEPKFLLVQGDFFGIQEFIFASGGETRRRAAKLLRGRSFYVSLLVECAALKIMDALGLPSTSQVINAAGKFLIVAPNTGETIAKLEAIQAELNAWFLKHTYGQSGLGVAWLPAACEDFTQGRFGELMRKLFARLEQAKLQRFNLCAEGTPSVFEGFLDEFDPTKGVCAVDGRSPGVVKLAEGVWISQLADDQIKVGGYLTKFKRLLITRENLDHNTLNLPIFGYYVSFTESEDITGKFGQLAREGKLLRAVDFALPEEADKPLWNGYARRAINAWIPYFTEADFDTFDKYEDTDELYDKAVGEAKTLNQLADEDKWMDEQGKWIGISALMTLKGDVDNLGAIFQRGLGAPNFAKMAALSRQMNAFFAIWLPYLCKTQFPNTYTVFAGGDDFFLIGPWRSIMSLAREMHAEFKRYVAENPAVHFSAGLALTKPGLPIPYLAELAEQALAASKAFNPKRQAIPPKNALTCFGRSVSWEEFDQLLQAADQLDKFRASLGFSTSYVYSLLHLTELAEGLSKRPENAIWRSRFQYRTYRMLESLFKGKHLQNERERWQNELAEAIAQGGIEKHKGNYRIALFTHLYQHRR